MDEAVYSQKQSDRRVWARPGEAVYRNKVGFRAVAVVAAVDVDGAVPYTLMREGAIDQDAFIDFLEGLRDRIAVPREQEIVLLVDNLAVHRTHRVRARSAVLKVRLLFNAPYSSEYNPIERLWAWSKQLWRSACLDMRDFKRPELIRRSICDALDRVASEALARHVRRCLWDMRDWLTANAVPYNNNPERPR